MTKHTAAPSFAFAPGDKVRVKYATYAGTEEDAASGDTFKVLQVDKVDGRVTLDSHYYHRPEALELVKRPRPAEVS